VRLLFGRERFTAELPWTDLTAVLPGWDIITCPRHEVSKHLDGVDVICPFGSRIDRAVLDSGTFGLVQQFGVGLEQGGHLRGLHARLHPYNQHLIHDAGVSSSASASRCFLGCGARTACWSR
jgi:hypothetical protein